MAYRCWTASATRTALSHRALNTSRSALAAQPFRLPSMSPTMEVGTISSWEVKEGEKFVAGDVLLKLETDKAMMDVEAQDDGVMAKIYVGDGTSDVPVGKVIAVLAEEGDNLATLDIPSEAESPSPQPSPPSSQPSSSQSSSNTTDDPSVTLVQGGSYGARGDTRPMPEVSPAKAHDVLPTHSQPLFPSVLFLLAENGISDASSIKATGKHGRLTKADVLLHLGKLPSGSVLGTAKDSPSLETLPEHTRRDGGGSKAKATTSEVPANPIDAQSFRRQILAGLAAAPARLAAAKAASSPIPLHTPTAISFDDLLAGYQAPTSPVARLDLSLGKAPRIGAGLAKSDPLRMVLEA